MFKFICKINGKEVVIVKDTYKDAKAFIRRCKYSKKVRILDIYATSHELLIELEEYESRIN